MFLLRRLFYLSLAVLCLISVATAQSLKDPVLIYTGDYPPYVDATGDNPGSATQIIDLVLDAMNLESSETRYVNYAYAFHQVSQNKAAISYPYFKTEARDEVVLFSRPLFEVTVRFFYNRRYTSENDLSIDRMTLKIGRVKGYSYGPDFDVFLDDRTVEFNTETEALSALIDGDIDLLPMAEGVAAALIERNFSERQNWVCHLPKLESSLGLHMIAPATTAGQAFIDKFNLNHKILDEAGALPLAGANAQQCKGVTGDVVDLVASEGFPIVVGRLESDPSQQFAIPQGTRAIVTDWSETIALPTKGKQLYDTMVSESVVVILNGPHVGKKMLIKNMHLSLTP